jgi:hypothetical protein
MKISRALVLTTALVGFGLLGAPASGTHGGIHPTFAASNVFFHCNGETKVYNVNFLGQGGAAGAYVPWDANPPSESVTDGAGCGGTDVGWVTNEVYDVVYQGTFNGNLRDMTVRLHEFIGGNLRESPTQRMRVYAEIDGLPIFPQGSTEGAWEGRAFTVTPAEDNSGATDLYEFSITNLGYAIDIFDEEGELIDVETGGMALEDGPGSNEHYLRIMFGIEGFPGEDPPTGSTAWVWDTTEVESGITFNPPTLASAKVAADLPDF